MFNIHFHIERWKMNKDYGVYVSTDGRIKDKNKKFIQPKIARNGYFVVRCANYKLIAVHKLVMLTWKGKQDNFTIDHLNSNRRDNRLCNLEYVPYQENLTRAQNNLLTAKENQECIVEKIVTPSTKTATGPISIIAATANSWLDILIRTCPSKVQNNIDRDDLVARILEKAEHNGTYFGYRMDIQHGRIVGKLVR